MRNQKGMTLIEIVIAMTIMAMLIAFISGTIRTSLKNKTKIEEKIRTQAVMYDALRIFRMDVEKAFNYQDVFYQIEKEASDQWVKECKILDPSGPCDKRKIPPPAERLTHFLGDSESIHFTSLNNFRTRYNAQESDQMEVGYFVDGCTSWVTKKETKCLWRRSAPHIDDEVDQGGDKFVLAEYVTEFTLSYRGVDELTVDSEPEWESRWFSNNQGEPARRNKFPDQVKVTLEIHNTDNKRSPRMKETMVINLNFPNNRPIYQAGKGANSGNQPPPPPPQ